jgi:hypothetical protein
MKERKTVMKAIKVIKVTGYRLQVTGYRLWVIVLLAVLPIVASAVEYKNMYRPTGYEQRTTVLAEAPTAVFQSTSTLAGSGSAYSATPTLDEDGTATYEGASSGPRRAKMGGTGTPGTPSTPGQGSQENQFPLGDAFIPLLLMVMAYATSILLRRRNSRV